MVGQALDMLGHSLPSERFKALYNAGMQYPPPLMEETPIGHFIGESVLEGILTLGKEPCLVQELGRLEVCQTTMQNVFGQLGNGLQQRQGHLRANDGGGLEEALCLGRLAVDARCQDG